MPSVTAIVLDDEGRILVVHKTDNALWALPGGGMDVGESMPNAVVREVKEETGLDVEVTGIVGIYTNPDAPFLTDELLTKANALWQQAEDLTAGEPDVLRRVKLSRSAWAFHDCSAPYR